MSFPCSCLSDSAVFATSCQQYTGTPLFGFNLPNSTVFVWSTAHASTTRPSLSSSGLRQTYAVLRLFWTKSSGLSCSTRYLHGLQGGWGSVRLREVESSLILNFWVPFSAAWSDWVFTNFRLYFFGRGRLRSLAFVWSCLLACYLSSTSRHIISLCLPWSVHLWSDVRCSVSSQQPVTMTLTDSAEYISPPWTG